MHDIGAWRRLQQPVCISTDVLGPNNVTEDTHDVVERLARLVHVRLAPLLLLVVEMTTRQFVGMALQKCRNPVYAQICVGNPFRDLADVRWG
jgi:hypothetical protein